MATTTSQTAASPAAADPAMSHPFDPVEQAIADVKAGKLVIVTDDEDRENEGDLIMAASLATPETVNMMIRYGSGIICVSTREEHLRRLGLNPMVQQNREALRTDFTVSVDAAQGITTGISASDRTRAIRIIADPQATAEQLVQPGHVFPLRARPGGVLERAGHTEAAVDLSVLAGLHPSGVLCEVMNDDGSCARLPDLLKFKEKFGLTLVSIADLIEYRHQRERFVERLSSRPLRTEYGEFQLHVFRNNIDGSQHYALSLGDHDDKPTLVRVHAADVVRDVFLSHDGTEGNTFALAMKRIAAEGRGVVLYLQHTGQQTDAAVLPGESTRTVGSATAQLAQSASLRQYGIGAQMLSSLGLKKIRLLTQSQPRVVGLEGYGLEIVAQEPLQ